MLNWTRTDLTFRMPSGSLALRLDAVDVAVYDLFVLERSDADMDYTAVRADVAQLAAVERNLIAGLPTAERRFDRLGFSRDISA